MMMMMINTVLQTATDVCFFIVDILGRPWTHIIIIYTFHQPRVLDTFV